MKDPLDLPKKWCRICAGTWIYPSFARYGSAAVVASGLLVPTPAWPSYPFTHALSREGVKTETGTRDMETGVMFVFMAKCSELPQVSMLFSISCCCSRALPCPCSVVRRTGQLKLNLSTYCDWHLTAFWDLPPITMKRIRCHLTTLESV